MQNRHAGRSSKDNDRQAATHPQRCCSCCQLHTEIWPRLVSCPSFWAALACRSLADRLQAWCHYVLMPARNSTAVPSELLHASVCPSDVPARQRLRSSSRYHRDIPRHRRSTYGGLAFSVAGPSVWNSLPVELRDPNVSIGSFRRSLKTWLFSQSTSAFSAFEGFFHVMRYINIRFALQSLLGTTNQNV